MVNIAFLIIKALRICPTSLTIVLAASYCDDDGNVEDDNPIISKLEYILEYGERHNNLYNQLVVDVEQELREPTDEQMSELKNLSLLVGIDSDIQLERLIRWQKFKNKVSTKHLQKDKTCE